MVRPEGINIAGEFATWEMNLTAPIGGTYLGTFKFRCTLNPIQVIQSDRDYRKLIGPDNPSLADIRSDNLAFCLSQLRQRVVEAPPFWSDGSEFPGSKVKDLEVVEEVLTAAIQAEREYRGLLTKRHSEAIDSLKKRVDDTKAAQETEEFFKEEPKKKESKRVKKTETKP